MSREATRKPIRTCVGCRRTRPQDELLRLARTPDGVRFDPDHRLPGRGAYLCPTITCIEAASRRGAAGLQRALKGATVDELQQLLEQDLRHQVLEGP